MTRRRPPPPLDLASPERVLAYQGGPLPDEVPARDLVGADLLRIARIRALRESGGQPVTAASAEELDALVAELAGGSFVRQSTEASGPEVPSEPTDEPAVPAEQET